jgi:hypothetical protein
MKFYKLYKSQNNIFTARGLQVMFDTEDEILRSKISTSNLKTLDENKDEKSEDK